MTFYNFPGYDIEPRDAASALQEWIDTQELVLDDEETETLYQFTNHSAPAEFNIRAIQAGADYAGIDLTHSPLPTAIETPVYAYSHAMHGGYLPNEPGTLTTNLADLIEEMRADIRYHLDQIENDETFLKYDTAMHVLGDVQITDQLISYGVFLVSIENENYSITVVNQP